MKEIGAIRRIVGIFTFPRVTFESINRKPMWVVPFLIVVILAIVMNFITMDIIVKDRTAEMKAQGLSEEQIESKVFRLEAMRKSIGGVFILVPLVMLFLWSILAGILGFCCNAIMRGDAKFQQVFPIVAWSYLVPILGKTLKSILILSKGTSYGIMTNLAILLPSPELGEKPSILYGFFSKLDLFAIWQLILLIIGLAVVYRFTTKKSAILVLSLWAFYIAITVLFRDISGPIAGILF